MHRRPRLILVVSLVAAAAVVVAVLVWWSRRPVSVAVPSGGSSATCTALADALPTSVHGQDRVSTSPSSPAVAAWGDPAVIWRCGVTPPSATTDECLEVDGVDWVVRQLDDGASFTTFGRDPAVQVLVPKAYSPEPLLLPSFSAVVRQVPQGPHRCS